MNEVTSGVLQTPIEIALGIDENGMTTARKLYDFLELSKGQFSRWSKANITDNEFAEDGVDYQGFDINVEGNIVRDFKLTSHFAKKLSMKGSGKRAEQAREYFTRVEEKAREMVINRRQLSPQMQMLMSMVEAQAKQELEQKRQAAELEQVKENQKAITQVLAKPAEMDFRSWVNSCLSTIAESEGFLYMGNSAERHRAVRAGSYERLNQKRPCRLEQRVTRARGEAATAGATKTQINAINKLSVIDADKDLKPVYESVIREMLVAYRVNP